LRIYLVRHGSAVRGGPYAEADRPLTVEGTAAVRGAARGLAQLGLKPRALLTSPARRCRDTAALLAVALGIPAGAVRAVDALASGCSPSDVLAELAGLGAQDEVLVVGHEPDLTALGSVFLATSGPAVLRFRPGSCACLEVEETPAGRRASLLWLLTPEELAHRSLDAPE